MTELKLKNIWYGSDLNQGHPHPYAALYHWANCHSMEKSSIFLFLSEECYNCNQFLLPQKYVATAVITLALQLQYKNFFAE